MRMKDKCGIVTAAGSGMGRAGAIRFAQEGAAVAVVDIDVEAVQAVVAEIEAAGGRAVGITADLTQDEDSRRIVREAQASGYRWSSLIRGVVRSAPFRTRMPRAAEDAVAQRASAR